MGIERGSFITLYLSEQSLEKYDEMVKKLGYKLREMRKEKNDPKTGYAEKNLLRKQIENMEKRSDMIKKLRDEMKKKAKKGYGRGRGLNSPLIRKLEVILGEIQAGNNSREMN